MFTFDDVIMKSLSYLKIGAREAATSKMTFYTLRPTHYDVMTRKHFPRYRSFVRIIHRWLNYFHECPAMWVFYVLFVVNFKKLLDK